MNKEKQLIAIAEACGWKPNPFLMDMRGQVFPQSPPDYLNDLNAMHEAEKVLSSKYEPASNDSQRGSYLAWLGYCGENNTSEVYGCVSATAAQRAEALLKALKLWKDA
jgi:hypothetical protein